MPADWPNRTYSRFVRAAGLNWHVQQMGTGPVMLLIHGTGAATHSWRDFLPIAAQHFTVIAFDLPGHGFTVGHSGTGQSLGSVAKAVAVLLDQIAIQPDIIIGHSAGAAIAIRMVLDSAIEAKAVVGIAAALLPFPGIAQHIFPAMAKLLFVNPFAPHIFAQVARRPGAVAAFLERSTGSHIDDAGVGQYARLFGASDHCAGALGMMANWNLAPLERDLPSLNSPLLLIHGDRDAAIPVMAARKVAATVPGAQIEVLVKGGHLLHEEAPRQIFDLVAAFSRDHDILPR